MSLLQQQEAFERERVARIANLPPPPPASDADAIHIVLKMPDGQRRERRFYSQDSLQVRLQLCFELLHNSVLIAFLVDCFAIH